MSNDLKHDILKKVDHDRWTFRGSILAGGILVWLIGCSSRTANLTRPDVKVTRAELQHSS